MTHPQLVGREIVIGREKRVLHLDRLVHEYPGKRLILQGHLDDGEPVAAKFYLGFLRQGWEWLRGLRGARLLLRSGVPSPRLHHAGYCREATAWLAVFQWVEADEPWPPSTWPLARADHERLVEILAAHHHAGIVQKDMNWRNFIPRSGRLYTVDTDRVHGRSAPLNRHRSFAHLMDVYASKSRIPDQELHWAYNDYCNQRGWRARDDERMRLIDGIRKSRVQHACMVAKRGVRGWKHYQRFAMHRWQVVFDERGISRDRVERIVGKHCEPGGAETIPPAGDFPATRMTVQAIPETTALSADFALAPFHNTPAAARAWVNAITLRRLGFPVPRGVALIKDRQRQKAWLLSETIDSTPLDSWLTGSRVQERDRALSTLRDLLAEMKKYRILNPAWRLDALGWGNDRIWMLDVSTIRFHPRLLPGFDRRWSRELESLLTGLSTTLQAPSDSLRLRIDPPVP